MHIKIYCVDRQIWDIGRLCTIYSNSLKSQFTHFLLHRKTLLFHPSIPQLYRERHPQTKLSKRQCAATVYNMYNSPASPAYSRLISIRIRFLIYGIGSYFMLVTNVIKSNIKLNIRSIKDLDFLAVRLGIVYVNTIPTFVECIGLNRFKRSTRRSVDFFFRISQIKVKSMFCVA